VSGSFRLPGSGSPALPRGAHRVGTLAGGTPVQLTVTLRLPDPAAVTSFIAAVSDRSSPLFHHFLRPGQFGARFGPSEREVAKVESALRARGLHPGPAAADRLSIPVRAPASTVERAFDVSLDTYRLPGGRIGFTDRQAPVIADSLRGVVDGVLGLSDLYRPAGLLLRDRAIRPLSRAVGHPRLATTAVGPQPCTAVTSQAGVYASDTANQLAAHYAMTGLYDLGDLGQGIHVGLAEFEPDSPADISAYESCYGISTAVDYHSVDGGAGTGSGSGEAALDIEDVASFAPKATLDVYQAPNSGDTATYDLYSAIINADRDQVVSTSWGLCEPDSDASLLSSEQTLFAQAATQAQTVLAAAGDSGSTDCLGDGTSNSSILAVDDPGSQPYVVSVGGTSIGTPSDTVWNDSDYGDGAGGGGVSDTWCMPSYQDQSAIPGLVNSDSQQDTAKCSATSSNALLRQVPDVSADANPVAGGYVIYYEGSWYGGLGGTSAAAPLWAAVAALVDASPFCADYGSDSDGHAGVLPQGLYKIAASDRYSDALNDVTSGNNDYTGTGGLYPATTGYDMASGLGTPLVSGLTASGATSTFYPGLAALMCWEYRTKLGVAHVTAVHPDFGPATRPTRVTITGSGFLPVAGADMAKVGSHRVPASCTSTTSCTAVIPAGTPGSRTIQISAEDLTLSAIRAADHYQALAAPAVTSLTPRSGRVGGGEKVTIRGRNFSHVATVKFGTTRAVHIRVVSSTEITVFAPAGHGTVHVTVTAGGGTSAASRHCRFSY